MTTLKKKGFPAKSLKELAKTPEHSFQNKFPGYQRDYLRRLKAEAIAEATPSREEQFKKFLIKGRSFKQIQEKFGEISDELLKTKYEGLNLFTQRNLYNEVIYILLPEPPKTLELLPKEYTYAIGKDSKDTEQPYLLIQLPDFVGKVTIVPLFDVHFGNFAHEHEKFLGYLRWIAETPNVYVILGGDLCENAIDDGRGMMYDQDENPMSQLDKVTKMLAPIAHKILVSVPGNHEERTYKHTGIDFAAVLADRLKVPYFSGPVWMSVLANTYRWTYYIFHGRGNSQTKGGKMNSAGRARKWTAVVHFFISGHVHDCVAESETLMVEDYETASLKFVKQWTVIAQAFLGWYNTYAYRAGYQPPAQGGVSTELFDDGRYRAHLTE